MTYELRTWAAPSEAAHAIARDVLGLSKPHSIWIETNADGSDSQGSTIHYVVEMAIDDDGLLKEITALLACGALDAHHGVMSKPPGGSDFDRARAVKMAELLDADDPESVVKTCEKRAVTLARTYRREILDLGATIEISGGKITGRATIALAVKAALGHWGPINLSPDARAEALGVIRTNWEDDYLTPSMTEDERSEAWALAERDYYTGEDHRPQPPIRWESERGHEPIEPYAPAYLPYLSLDDFYAERAARHEAANEWAQSVAPFYAARSNHPAPRARAVRTLTPTRGATR